MVLKGIKTFQTQPFEETKSNNIQVYISKNENALTEV